MKLKIKRILSRARGLLNGLTAWECELDDGTLVILNTIVLVEGHL